MRPKIITLTQTSPASASTAASTNFVGDLSYFNALSFIATLQGGTGGTLDVYLQTSFDDGVTWYDYAHYAQLAAGAAQSRILWHVNRSTSVTAPTTIGTGTSPALAVSTINGGAWGDRLRLLFVAGAGTSAGASQSVSIIAQAQA